MKCSLLIAQQNWKQKTKKEVRKSENREILHSAHARTLEANRLRDQEAVYCMTCKRLLISLTLYSRTVTRKRLD